MGGPYEIPRNYKGESKILFVFSGKSFIYTGIGGLIGVGIDKILFEPIHWSTVGIIGIVILAFIGFAIGTFKMPEGRFDIMKKTGGENIDDVIKRWIKFRKNKNKIYIYKDGEVHKDE